MEDDVSDDDPSSDDDPAPSKRQRGKSGRTRQTDMAQSTWRMYLGAATWLQHMQHYLAFGGLTIPKLSDTSSIRFLKKLRQQDGALYCIV